MSKEYKCALCRLAFESEQPQMLTHPDDWKTAGVSPEEAAQYPPVICPDCLKSAQEEEERLNMEETT